MYDIGNSTVRALKLHVVSSFDLLRSCLFIVLFYSFFILCVIHYCCTATFENPNARANVVITTGWSETFLQYASFIRTLYDEGYNVYTYDHQSQGLSGRLVVTRHHLLWIVSSVLF
jgi:hypothetical protein